MNSPFATIFLALSQHIQDNMPAIACIDQELGQLKSSRPPVSWPCVLIDFEEFTYENLGANVQTACGTITLRLGFAPYSSSSAAAPLPYTRQAISYYDIEWDLHRALQGWAPGADFGHLCRTSIATQRRTDSYRVRELRYSISFPDYSTLPAQQYAPATLVISTAAAV